MSPETRALTRTLVYVTGLLTASASSVVSSTVTLLDTTGQVGGFPSVAIGTDGLGLIAYLDATNADLKVAHCSNTACTAATLSTIDAAGDVGRFASLAVGADGRGIVAYFDVSGQALKTAHCGDQACTSATVKTVDAGGAVAGQIGITIGTDGLPVISYARDTGPLRLAIVHCSDAVCGSAVLTELADLPENGLGAYDTAIVVGADGLPLVAYTTGTSTPDLPPGMAHCANVACTALTGASPARPAVAAKPAFGIPVDILSGPSLVLGTDGLALLSYRRLRLNPVPFVGTDLHLRHCANITCTAFDSDETLPSTTSDGGNAPLATGAGGMPWFVRSRFGRVRLTRCADASCTLREESCAPVRAGGLSLARGADDVALAAIQAADTADLAVIHGFDPCVPSVASVADASAPEPEPDAPLPFVDVPVTLDQPPDAEGTLDYATADGTALAGVDYIAASGTLTFYPGSISHGIVRISLLADTLDEPDEHFSLLLSNPQGGVVLGDGTADVTIVDDDDPSLLATGDCAAPEGDATGGTCTMPVSLSPVSGHTVTVAYTTADGTATAGTDYVAASGTVTFAPGETQKTVSVAVIGDTTVEPDETFRVLMATPANAVLFNATGQGAIVDDDFTSLSTLEVTHGTRLVADLSGAAGVDLYRLAQPALTSWEVVLDAASGDAVPGLTLERLAADGSTVLQTGGAVGTGAAVALRFANRFTAPVVSQHLRVRSTACGTACDAGDTYRLRVYDTTGRLTRFNNGGTQRTVLLLQNTTDAPVDASVDFWGATGERLVSLGVALGPHGLSVVDTSTIAPVAGASGSITITSDAPYGGLSGKAVALDLFTFFALDTPLEYRPR
jgi:hypothetical protein